MEYLELDEQQSIDLIKKTVRMAHVAKEKYLTECYESQLAVNEGKKQKIFIYTLCPQIQHFNIINEIIVLVQYSNEVLLISQVIR